MFVNLGLLLITTAWLIQLFSTSSKKQKINPLFLTIYALGAFILVIDGFNAGMQQTAILNLLTVILAGGILLRIKN